MSRTALVSVLFLLLVGLALVLAASPSPERMRAMFAVDGMHCDGCSATITTTLKRIKGVSDAGADHDTGSAWAVYAPTRTTVDAMKRAIEALGYTVTAASAEPVETSEAG